MQRTLPTVLCLALLAGGCGGGSDEPPVEHSGAAGRPATAVRVRAQAWATGAEVAWARPGRRLEHGVRRGRRRGRTLRVGAALRQRATRRCSPPTPRLWRPFDAVPRAI